MLATVEAECNSTGGDLEKLARRRWLGAGAFFHGDGDLLNDLEAEAF
jgi:hypothetical protein